MMTINNYIFNKISLKALAALFVTCCSLSIESCAQQKKEKQNNQSQINMSSSTYDTATFGAGCFWCVEAQFQLLEGVISVSSGFSGGSVKNPSYKEVCTGTTGHAEVCQIIYDTTKLSYADMLEAFWKSHDPTQLNQQGNDLGTQYRSVIFYHNKSQQLLATELKNKLNESGAFDRPIVTEISPFTIFYKAEDYHQNYFNENGEAPYCHFVIQPKVEKFTHVFKGKIKKK
jgi:peptide-methionine (S)-S-oxide reductase